MGMTCGLEVGGFCRLMVLLVCVQAEVSPSAPSERMVLAGCVHQYCCFWPCMQVGVGVPNGLLCHQAVQLGPLGGCS
jgi:hypothetical protein